MAVGFQYFTILLRFIGLPPVGKNRLVFHLTTWIPNLILVTLVSFDYYMSYGPIAQRDDSARIVPSKYNDSVVGHWDKNRTENEGSNKVLTRKIYWTSIFFDCQDIFYRISVFVLFFSLRFHIAEVKKQLGNYQRHSRHSERFKDRITQFGITFIMIHAILYALSMYGIVTDTVKDWDSLSKNGVYARISICTVTRVAGIVSALAIEGFVIYFTISFEYILKNFNDRLQQPIDHEQDETDKQAGARLQRTRLKLMAINDDFQSVKAVMSPMLCVSLCNNLAVVCFGIFVIDKWSSASADATLYNNLVLFVLFVNAAKFLCACFIGEFAHKEVLKTCQILSKMQFQSTDNIELVRELIHLLEARHYLSFRLSVGGFCELKRSLIPTVILAITTYTVILCQD